MRLSVIVYADDLKSACTTVTVILTNQHGHNRKGGFHTFKEITLFQLKQEIEQQVRPRIPLRNQILSIKRNGVLVRVLAELKY